MAKLQELIAEQTDIRAAEQYMLFENVKFSDFIEPMEMARNYPMTSDTSPLFLFPSAAESLALPPVPVRECTAALTRLVALMFRISICNVLVSLGAFTSILFFVHSATVGFFRFVTYYNCVVFRCS